MAQFPADIEEALARFIAEEPNTPAREEAVERLVRESLEKLGLLEPPKV
ncbi:MAG: hypothetical protein NXI17_23665 [Alphaproteobacteria bacterium]|nr:hypothetical protein [Alphaproteobacteria bacterium]